MKYAELGLINFQKDRKGWRWESVLALKAEDNPWLQDAILSTLKEAASLPIFSSFLSVDYSLCWGSGALSSWLGHRPQSVVSFTHKVVVILPSPLLCSHRVASNAPWSIVWQMCSKTNTVPCEGGMVGDLEMEDGKPFRSFYIPQGVFDVNSLVLSSNVIIGHLSASGLA